MPHLICPACQAKVPLKISAGETKVECPNCHKAIKVKLPSQQPAPANLAPAAPVVDELRLPQEPLAPLSDAPFPELSPAGDLDEYRLADERLTPLSEPPLDDLNMDEIAPLAPMEPPATAPLAAAPRPAEKRPSQAESDTAAGGKRGIILAAVGGGVGLLCLVLFGAWMMSGRRRRRGAEYCRFIGHNVIPSRFASRAVRQQTGGVVRRRIRRHRPPAGRRQG
jgi:hypothetical protein